MDIYKTPKANLDKPEKILGPMPGLIKLIFILFFLESTISMIPNYMDSEGYEKLILTESTSIFIIAFSFLIVIYCWFLLKTGNKFILTLAYIFLGMNLVFSVMNWVDVGFRADIGDVIAIINIVLLFIIVVLLKSQKAQEWLIE